MAYADVIRLPGTVTLPESLADNAFIDAEARASDRVAFAEAMVQAIRQIERAFVGTARVTGTDLDRWEREALREATRAKVDQAEARRLLRISGASRCDDGADVHDLGHGRAA